MIEGSTAPLGTGDDDSPLAAGDFGTWLLEMQGALAEERSADVPCGGCTACCTSSQFVHIGPDEVETRAHIPAALLFPAPGGPRGHVVLGYDERGHCPMLIDNRCSIYQYRPRACRTYDCRIFPAAGLVNWEKGAIAARAARWRFRFPAEIDDVTQRAVHAAARCLDQLRPQLPALANTTQRAVLAVEIHDLFLAPDEDPDPELVLAEVMRRTTGRAAF